MDEEDQRLNDQKQDVERYTMILRRVQETLLEAHHDLLDARASFRGEEDHLPHSQDTPHAHDFPSAFPEIPAAVREIEQELSRCDRIMRALNDDHNVGYLIEDDYWEPLRDPEPPLRNPEPRNTQEVSREQKETPNVNEQKSGQTDWQQFVEEARTRHQEELTPSEEEKRPLSERYTTEEDASPEPRGHHDQGKTTADPLALPGETDQALKARLEAQMIQLELFRFELDRIQERIDTIDSYPTAIPLDPQKQAERTQLRENWFAKYEEMRSTFVPYPGGPFSPDEWISNICKSLHGINERLMTPHTDPALQDASLRKGENPLRALEQSKIELYINMAADLKIYRDYSFHMKIAETTKGFYKETSRSAGSLQNQLEMYRVAQEMYLEKMLAKYQTGSLDAFQREMKATEPLIERLYEARFSSEVPAKIKYAHEVMQKERTIEAESKPKERTIEVESKPEEHTAEAESKPEGQQPKKRFLDWFPTGTKTPREQDPSDRGR